MEAEGQVCLFNMFFRQQVLINSEKYFRHLWQRYMDDPMFQMADVNLKFTKPELRIHIDREKASTLGVSTQNIGQTLQLALSGQRFGYFFYEWKTISDIG